MASRTDAQRLIRRLLLHPLQAVLAPPLYTFFRLLPLPAASALGGWLARTLGPRMAITNRARNNLRRAMPELDRAAVERIVRGMWDNLGRAAAEFAHLRDFVLYAPGSRVAVEGVEHVDRMRDDGVGGFFFSAHFGNWELISLGATQRGVPLDRVYRAANNRMVEWLYRRGRAAVEGALIPKGAHGARHVIAALKAGRHVGMMVDQRMNDGIAVPFFGLSAMTAPALAELALRYDVPVVPARVVRERGARFRLIVEPPLPLPRSGDHHADVLALMTAVNARIEAWVRENPEQWLWLHERWGANGNGR